VKVSRFWRLSIIFLVLFFEAGNSDLFRKFDFFALVITVSLSLGQLNFCPRLLLSLHFVSRLFLFIKLVQTGVK